MYKNRVLLRHNLNLVILRAFFYRLQNMDNDEGSHLGISINLLVGQRRKSNMYEPENTMLYYTAACLHEFTDWAGQELYEASCE